MKKGNVFFILLTMLLLSCQSSKTSNSNASSSDHPVISSGISAIEGSGTSSHPESDSGEENYLSTNEVLANLKESPYQNNMNTTENIGLENIKDVGINQDKYLNEERYPAPKEGTFYLAEDYDITPESNNNSGNLSMLIASLKGVEGTKIIKFKSGNYVFGTTVTIQGIDDLYILGEDDTCFNYAGWGTYFDVKISNNIHINNIKFDMIHSPTIAGTIKNVSETETSADITLDIPDEFDLSDDLYTSWQQKQCSYMECYYDESSKGYVPDRNANLFYNSASSSSLKGVTNYRYNSAAKEITVTLNKSFPYCAYRTPKIGTKVSFAYTMYENHGFYFLDCNGVYLENVDVYVTGGMGFRVERGSDINLNRVHFAPKKDSHRIMTCTADIIHTIAVNGEVNITNCSLEGSHDDALNIKTFYTKITSVNASAKEITVEQTQNEVSIEFSVGDKIDVYNPENMAYVDTYEIVDLLKNGTSYIFTLNKRPNRDILSYNVGNATKITKLKLHNSLIQNKRNRGILLQARDSEISNCTFRNVVMGAIQVLAVTDMFREAIVPQNIKIFNNKFIRNYDDISVFSYGSAGAPHAVSDTILNTEIRNNYFCDGNGTAVYLLGNGHTSVESNLFHYPEKSPELISVINSNDIAIKNNTVYCKNSQEIVFVSQTDVTLLAEENNQKKEL